MHRHDQGCQLLPLQVLDLVDEHGDSALLVRRSLRDRDEEVGQIDLEVPAVGRAHLGVDVESNAQLAVGELDGTDEAAKNPEPAAYFRPRSRQAVQVEEQAAKVRREKGREALAFMRLDVNGEIAARAGLSFDLVEQHGFADAAKPGQQHAFSGRPSRTRPRRIRASSRIESRPTSSGGGEPAPGEKGFLIASKSVASLKV